MAGYFSPEAESAASASELMSCYVRVMVQKNNKTNLAYVKK